MDELGEVHVPEDGHHRMRYPAQTGVGALVGQVCPCPRCFMTLIGPTAAGAPRWLSPATEVLTAAGAVRVRAPRVVDGRVNPETPKRLRFSSAILPAWTASQRK